jgi:hypothetical protein
MRASLFEPLTLDPGELERMAPSRPPGSCSGCGLPATAGKPMCWYCTALHEITRQAQHPVASPVAAELAKRALSCAHHTGSSASWIRDGRCQRCGRYAARPARGRHPVLLLVTGMAVIYTVVLAGLPDMLSLIGVLLILTAFSRPARP